MRAQAGIVLCLILFLRLPFLNQAIQGDDFYYLKGAEHALIDPLHPTHVRYIFQGALVDMRGHPHPPLNTWYLALLLDLFRSEAEVPLHAAYILFSLIAGMSALALARKFSTRPLMATILFLVTPAFVVNGGSLESDLPFTAFWLASIALVVYERWWLAAFAGVLAALAAYQAIMLVPVIAVWLLLRRKRHVTPWIAALAAPVTIAVWQLYERLTSGALPATVLAGYMSSYNLQAFTQKMKNAAALTGHTAWLVFPLIALAAFWPSAWWVRAGAAAVGVAAAIADPNPLFWMSCAVGALVILRCASHARDFLSAWVLIFFGGALVIFFAGSARYLLPVVVPIAILVSNRMNSRWLIAGAAAEAVIAIGLAVVNYQHWDGYRRIASALNSDIQRHRTWTNAEWGLRHYLEIEGSRPVQTGQVYWPGDLVITSAYSGPGPAGAVLMEHVIQSSIPLRIVGLGTDSAYSSVAFGLAPFGVSRAPMDRVRAVVISQNEPELPAITIGTPEAAKQIVTGIYNDDRWTAGRAVVMLKRPAGAARIEARIFIPPQAPARVITLSADGKLLKQETVAGPGAYTMTALAPSGNSATITLEVDKTFSVPPDQRELGVVLLSIGFR